MRGKALELTRERAKIRPQLDSPECGDAVALPDYAFEVVCKACGESVQFTLSDLRRTGVIACSHAHVVPVTSLTGLAEALAFIDSLVGVTERLTRS
jgi:hypothetical protein